MLYFVNLNWSACHLTQQKGRRDISSDWIHPCISLFELTFLSLWRLVHKKGKQVIRNKKLLDFYNCPRNVNRFAVLIVALAGNLIGCGSTTRKHCCLVVAAVFTNCNFGIVILVTSRLLSVHISRIIIIFRRRNERLFVINFNAIRAWTAHTSTFTGFIFVQHLLGF